MKVLKDFKTASRKFTAGDDVTAADIDGPNSFETWQERGFIAKLPDRPAKLSPRAEAGAALTA